MAIATKVVFLLVVFMVAAAPAAEAALQCGDVSPKLIPCMSYLVGGPGPTSSCCDGVRALKDMAKTPQDRQAICGCLKSAAGSIPGLKEANVASLPSKCGVSVPYPISPKTDCSKVH